MRPYYMHPYPHLRFHSWAGPRRLVWFILGATAATMWHTRKEAHGHTTERYFGHCFRPPVQHRPASDVQPMSGDARQWRPRDIPNTINNIPPAPALPWGYPEMHRDRQWEEEKIKLQAFGKQAEEAMTQLSEATLDSVLTTVETLKQKLVEHRAERQKAQELLEKQLEEERKNPHRFV
ncbi:hypothetical protein C8J57DRAFT_1173799 [Mycena rebaudengoi]|nr:hypothetical protein C8J57DRAFT_1173799 [Mycena rebaudengoi]